MKLLSMLLLLMLLTRVSGAACDIVIGSSHREPLTNASGSGIVDGLVVEMFHRIGHSACITPLPAERSLLNANSGITDGDILRVREVIVSGRYPNLHLVPEVLYPLPISGFTRRNDLQPKALADLVPLRIGFVTGWKILEEQVKAVEISRVRGVEELFALLAEDKVDLVIYERLTGQHLLEQLGIEGVRVVDPPLLVTPQYLVLHRRHQALLEPLAAALRAMKAEGGYERAFRAAGVGAPKFR